MKRLLILLFVTGSIFAFIFLGACSPSQVDKDAISSEVTADISFDQTTASTDPPTKTLPPTDTAVPATMIPTSTFTPTPTKTPTFQAAIISTCDPFDRVYIDRENYIVHGNVWNPSSGGEQCLSVDNLSGAFSVESQTHAQPTNGAPASYPFIYMGCHWGYCSSPNTMPILVSNISSARSSWSFTTASGAWNAAYDIWFNSTPTTNDTPDRAELMIWLNSNGSVGPGGSVVANNVEIDGHTYNIHYAPHDNLRYIAYRKTSPVTSLEFDIMAFINDAISRDYIEPSWYLIAVEAGFEIWNGGEGLRSDSFSVSVDSVPESEMISAPGGATDGNMLRNGDFSDGFFDWVFLSHTSGGVLAEASVAEGVAVGFKNLIRQKTGQKRWQTDHC